MPAARHNSRSPLMALAVRAMMGMRLPSGVKDCPDASSRRISLDAAKPSISGIWQSIRMTS